jgi:hypothetical protein
MSTTTKRNSITTLEIGRFDYYSNMGFADAKEGV